MRKPARRRPPPDTSSSGEPSPPVPTTRKNRGSLQPLWPSMPTSGRIRWSGEARPPHRAELTPLVSGGSSGQRAGAMADARAGGLCPYSSQIFDPQWIGGGPQQPEAARQAPSATRPDRPVAVLRPLASPGRGLHRPEATTFSAGGKQGTVESKATPSPADGSGRADSCQPCRRPHICDSRLLSGINRKSVLGRSEAGSQTFRQGPEPPSIRQNAAGRQVHHQQAGQVPSSKAHFQWGSGAHQKRFRARSARSRTMWHHTLARAVPCRYVNGF